MAKYKVGDQVRVKQYYDCERIGKVDLISSMITRCDTIVTISKVLDADGEWLLEPVYYIKEDKHVQYYWSESWLEPLEGEEQ